MARHSHTSTPKSFSKTAKSTARSHTDTSLVPAHEAIQAHALDTFGSPAKANHWLNRPNPLLGGKSPLQVMQDDPQAVEAELVRIDHNVYV